MGLNGHFLVLGKESLYRASQVFSPWPHGSLCKGSEILHSKVYAWDCLPYATWPSLHGEYHVFIKTLVFGISSYYTITQPILTYIISQALF